MDLVEINQKLDKILEYQEKQAHSARLRFWINFVIIFVFIVLPLILLPFAVSQVFNLYSGIGSGDLQGATDQAQNLMGIFGQ